MDANTFWIFIPALLIGLLAMIAANGRTVRLAALRAQVQRALIDKVSSREDLESYLNSASTQRFFDGGAVPTLEKALESIRTGLILSTAGVACCVWTAVDRDVPLGIGLLALALGLGFLVAGFVTRHLAGRWGLLDDRNAR